MSWMLRLYETYEKCTGMPQFDNDPLTPPSHTTQNAHVDVFLDVEGRFLDAKAIPATNTVIPATEKSMTGRTSGSAPFPLCEKIQYCGADYPNFDGRSDGKKKKSYFKDYFQLLSEWCNSEYAHPKVKAVQAYVGKGSLVNDLIEKKVLQVDIATHKLLTEWPIPKDKNKPEIFRVLQKADGFQDQGNVFIRWHVQNPGDPASGVWQDRGVVQSWIDFDGAKSNKDARKALCFVSGKETVVAKKHPGKIRHNGDGAKLISSQNDENTFKYLGRFFDAEQACQVGLDVSQKAHNALRWLIQRQGYRNDDLAIVTWDTGGEDIPNPYADTFDLLGGFDEDQALAYSGNAGEGFAQKFKTHLKGYSARLGSTNRIVAMAVDSASPGRMAITYYRELGGSEFLDRVQQWHLDYAWPQNFGLLDKKREDQKKSLLALPLRARLLKRLLGKRHSGKRGPSSKKHPFSA